LITKIRIVSYLAPMGAGYRVARTAGKRITDTNRRLAHGSEKAGSACKMRLICFGTLFVILIAKVINKDFRKN